MAPSSNDGTIESDARAFVNLFTLFLHCYCVHPFYFLVMHIAQYKVAKRKTNPLLLQSKCRKEPKEKEKVRRYRTFTIVSRISVFSGKGKDKSSLANCSVCGIGMQSAIRNHYGGKVCYPCRAFFRRISQKGCPPLIDSCNRISEQVGECQFDESNRQLCR